MTELSLQRHNRNAVIQFRLEDDLKFVWSSYCEQEGINQSELFRLWILAYMKKKNVIREIKIPLQKFNSIEEMTVDMKFKTKIEVCL